MRTYTGSPHRSHRGFEGRPRSRRHRHWPVTPGAAGQKARASLGGQEC